MQEKVFDYKQLLDKAKKEMPAITNDKSRFEIPIVKGHIQGTKTIITNLFQISSQMRRPIEHLLKYLQKELATPGEIKENGSVIFGRKLSSADMNTKIKKYVEEFVFCKDCGKPDTEFLKENDITFVKCLVCGSKHPVKSLV